MSVLIGIVLRTLLILLGLASASCTVPPPAAALVPSPPPQPADPPTPDAVPSAEIASGETSTAPIQAPRVAEMVLSGIPITALAFDSRSHRLVIADQPGGPASRWPDAKAAAASRRGLAALNGGFFTPEGAPLGLLVAGSKTAGSLNRASSLGAGLLVADGSPALVRRESGRRGPELLQSGPFLVEHGRPVAGLSPESSTARSFVGWDGGHRWFIARSGPCSLLALGKALASAEIGGVSARSVLNLDGGRSSDLWIGPSVPGGPLEQRPFWNNPVRNFLILLPR